MKGCALGRQKDFAFRIPFSARNPITNYTSFCFPFNSLAFLLYIFNASIACFEKVIGSGKQGAGQEFRVFELCASLATDLLVTMEKSSSILTF